MSTLKDLYLNLLESREVPLELQHRIFANAVANKDHALAVKLLNHPSLDQSVDDKLRDVEAAAVKAAWAARPGRSTAELTALVDAEKRANVLTALAERTDLPEEVYVAIAAKATGIKTLSALVSNSNAPSEARDRALAALLVPRTPSFEPEHGLDTATVAAYSRTFQIAGGVASKHVEQADDMHLLAATAQSGIAIPADRQVHLTKSLLETFGEAAKTAPDAWNGLMAQMSGLARAIANTNPGLDKQAAAYLTELLGTFNPDPDRGQARNIAYAAKEIEEAVKRHSKIGSFPLSDVESTDALKRLMEGVKKAYNANELTARDLTDLTNMVVKSKYSTPELCAEACNWSWNRADSETITLTDDPAKQAAIIGVSHIYYGLDRILKRLKNPAAVLGAMIDQSKDGFDRHDRLMLESKFLTEELLGRMPARAFFDAENIERPRLYVQQRLLSELGTDEAWNMFETLSDDFAGSIDDLFNVAASL